MIEKIELHNFKALHSTTLILDRFTLIIGPNGSGKSSVLQAIDCLSTHHVFTRSFISQKENTLSIKLTGNNDRHVLELKCHRDKDGVFPLPFDNGKKIDSDIQSCFQKWFGTFQMFSFEVSLLTQTVALEPNPVLGRKGERLAGVLDQLRDTHPENFDSLNNDLNIWLPEFDRVLFQTPNQGLRSISLRQKDTGSSIPATQLSDGTLFALAILTISHLPSPPSIVAFEEPDRGIHPRLLRDVRDALYRLAYPEKFGENRDPVQVIVTTHSPYLVDLFKDHPEAIVIAEKHGAEATFKRLVDIPNYQEIIGEASLGEAWYTGVFGGVPTKS